MISISLKERVVLITGATRGIGMAIAKECLRAGANLILTGTKDGGKEILDEELKKVDEKQTIEYISVDFNDKKSLYGFIDFLKSKKQIDICINNAGTNHIKPIVEIDLNDIQALHQINLYAPFLILSVVLDKMKQQQWGRVVNIGSLWSKLSRKGRSLYSASKHGLAGLTVTAALEYAPHNILINMV